MRGKVRMCTVLRYGRRITPAHAGKRGGADMTQMPEKDHPRACGEKQKNCPLVSVIWGSPPRMRGKALFLSVLWVTSGITPAHAGKRGRQACSIAGSEDHPRACGEKTATDIISGKVTGSPPRMRGKVLDIVRFVSLFGITPAHAGKSICTRRCATHRRDHPRACGEKLPPRDHGRVFKGSPPRMRGKD